MLARFAAGWRVGAGKAPSHKVKDKPKTSRVRKIKVKAKHWANAKAQDRPPASSPPTEDQRIADELGLRADLGIGELRRIRRDFAKRNHPDRFEPAQRLGAARRMTIANMLIDAHMKQKPPL